ncbi:MAG: PAS domain S-box protein, partial [Rhodospirillaceae bacterium]
MGSQAVKMADLQGMRWSGMASRLVGSAARHCARPLSALSKVVAPGLGVSLLLSPICRQAGAQDTTTVTTAPVTSLTVPLQAAPAEGLFGFSYPQIALAVAALVIIVLLINIWRTRRQMALLRDSLDVTKRARQLVDSSGRVRFANAAYGKIFPTVDVPLISTLSSLIAAGSDAAHKLQQLTLSLEQTGQGRADIDVIMQSGDREILDVSAYQLHGFSGFVLWSLDIVTEQRQIEEYIRSDHEKFADLVEHAPIGFYSVDENGAFQFVNETLESWLDLQSDENGVFTVKLHDLIVGPLPPGTPSYSPFADPAARSGEVMLRRPNGQVMQAYIRHAVAAVQAGGRRTAIRTRSVVHDLSREQELERALQVSEQYFQRFFEEAPTGIALIDTAGRIEQANRAFQQLADAGNWRDAPMIELVHPDDRSAVTEHFTAVLDNGRPLGPLTVRLAGQAHRQGAQRAAIIENGRKMLRHRAAIIGMDQLDHRRVAPVPG